MIREFDFTTTPIVDIVNDIIIDSVIRNASDIHFDPAEKYLKIRIRVDGELRDYTIIDNKYKRNLTTRVKLLAGMNITESRLPQDGAIKSVIEGKDLDLRVSALPTSFGEKIVIRILDYSMSLQGIEHLGFTGENYNTIMEMLNSPNGIILITGATGSGKSTTVYSMLQRLNVEESNIITVEDPVEMSIEGLNQVQVNSEIGLDFATVLRSILRQDPNIILIGEIRDSETAKIAVRASITGHLVLSTLHTNNSLTTIERLIDMDVERYLLSSSLKGIISQTLAKRLCPSCRVQRPANESEKILYKKALGVDINYVFEAGRCEHCHNGYTGRIALQEVLMINDEIRDAINKNIDREELRSLIYKKHVKTLFQDGLIKAMEGITDLKEVFRLVDYDEYDDVSEKIIEENNKFISENNSIPEPNQENQIYTAPVEQQPSFESQPQVNIIPEPQTSETQNNIQTNDYEPIVENTTTNEETTNQNIVTIPNFNSQPEIKQTPEITQNQIFTPEPTPTNLNLNSNLEMPINNNPNANLFDDNIFNSLRLDSNNNQANNSLNNQINTNNYTDNLLNLINNDLNNGAQ